MARKTVLTPRMVAEIAVAEIAQQYRNTSDMLDDLRRQRVRAAETVAAAEHNLAELSKECDRAYVLKRDLFQKLQKAQDEYGRLESEFTNSVEAKLLTDGEDS